MGWKLTRRFSLSFSGLFRSPSTSSFHPTLSVQHSPPSSHLSILHLTSHLYPSSVSTTLISFDLLSSSTFVRSSRLFSFPLPRLSLAPTSSYPLSSQIYQHQHPSPPSSPSTAPSYRNSQPSFSAQHQPPFVLSPKLSTNDALSTQVFVSIHSFSFLKAFPISLS